jgi:hypothetical protein
VKRVMRGRFRRAVAGEVLQGEPSGGEVAQEKPVGGKLHREKSIGTTYPRSKMNKGSNL